MLAYFHTTKKNVLIADLRTPDPFDRVAIGKAMERRGEGGCDGGHDRESEHGFAKSPAHGVWVAGWDF
jgi:hypothetical protein